jgi:hypothetical protein
LADFYAFQVAVLRSPEWTFEYWIATESPKCIMIPLFISALLPFRESVSIGIAFSSHGKLANISAQVFAE